MGTGVDSPSKVTQRSKKEWQEKETEAHTNRKAIKRYKYTEGKRHNERREVLIFF